MAYLEKRFTSVCIINFQIVQTAYTPQFRLELLLLVFILIEMVLTKDDLLLTI